MVPILAALALAPLAYSPAVQTASREDIGGWIVLHLSGTPREVGFEHGELASAEIADAVKTCQVDTALESGEPWSWYRERAKTLFWPKLDQEYRDEIEGIAAGAQSKGATVDRDDILALNSYIELEDYYLPKLKSEGQAFRLSGAPTACSAFVATGSETKDGRPVMGHNFWFDYLMGERFRVILDIRPEHGNHLLFDALPGFIESGTDWAINSAGIALCETTISDFVGFDENGVPEFERMRKAIQYSNCLDDVAHIFKVGNNGGYANTWLMADTKTNEIGKLQLGLKNVIFSTTTEGYYVGSNFPEDPKLMKEEAPGYKGGNCEARRLRWIQHLDENKGKIDAPLAEKFLGDSYDESDGSNDGGGAALCGRSEYDGAINAKVCTADSVSQMRYWARMGVPDGSDLVADPQSGYGKLVPNLFHSVQGEPWVVIQGK